MDTEGKCITKYASWPKLPVGEGIERTWEDIVDVWVKPAVSYSAFPLYVMAVSVGLKSMPVTVVGKVRGLLHCQQDVRPRQSM